MCVRERVCVCVCVEGDQQAVVAAMIVIYMKRMMMDNENSNARSLVADDYGFDSFILLAAWHVDVG